MTDEEFDNWVYDLEGKPWGVTEVEEKLLSLRAEDDGRTTTRRFIRPKIAREKPAGQNVRVELHHQKRLDGAIPDGRLNLSSLRDGEWTWLDLDRDETRRLYHHLESLYALGGADALLRGYQHLRVSGPGEAVIPKEYIELIEAIAKDRGPEVFAILRRLQPHLLVAEALTQQHQERSKALATFEEHMAKGDPWSEEDWQAFFEANDWIFGHGLAYQFLVNEQAKPHLGGVDVTGSGAQYGDFMMSTAGAASFSVIVEIKKPGTPIMGNRSYRNGAWLIGGELAAGVAQVQANCQLWAVETSQTKANEHWLQERGIRVIEPKGILVIGDFSSLKVDDGTKTEERIETFERFRRNLANPEVVTYDELLERAKVMIHRTKPEAAEGLVLTVTSDSNEEEEEYDSYANQGTPPDCYQSLSSFESETDDDEEEREPDPDEALKERHTRLAPPPLNNTDLDDLPF